MRGCAWIRSSGSGFGQVCAQTHALLAPFLLQRLKAEAVQSGFSHFCLSSSLPLCIATSQEE